MPRISDPALRSELGNPGAVMVLPPGPPKPPTNFGIPGSLAPVAPIPGGPDDPAYIKQIQQLKTSIDVGGQIAAARARTGLELGADAIKRQREIQAELEKEARKGSGLQGDARNDALQKMAALKLLQGQVARVQAEYRRTLAGRGPVQSASEFLPAFMAPSNSRFDATVDGLRPLARAAFRVPGSGADSDKESDAFNALLPNRWSNDAANEQRIGQMNQIINDSIAEQSRLLGSIPRRAIPGAPPKRAAAAPAPRVIDFRDLKD